MRKTEHKIDRRSPLMRVAVPAWNAIKDSRNVPRRIYGARASRSATTNYHKVVLTSNLGLGYLCNPKYIAEALNRLYPGEFDLVLLVNRPQDGVPGYVRQVMYGSREAQDELAEARFWIDNCRGAKYVPKRDDQVYIQAWHACLGPKRCERDAEDHLPYQYLKTARHDGSITDFMLADNLMEARKYQRAFWYDGPVLRCGVPRNRPLVLGDESARVRVCQSLGIPDGAAVCLYAPTFRADGSVEAYRFDYEAVRRSLEERFGRPFVFAYRLHPNLAGKQRPEFMSSLVDATGYPDQQELLAATDVLISDYSSILEDFALTRRPGFVYAPDLDAYGEDRGLYYPLSRRPFPVATTEGGLIREIGAFAEGEFRSSLEGFFAFAGLEDDGHGDECVARLIRRLSEGGSTPATVLPDIDVWPRGEGEER